LGGAFSASLGGGGGAALVIFVSSAPVHPTIDTQRTTAGTTTKRMRMDAFMLN
jgi:hypothetical protein